MYEQYRSTLVAAGRTHGTIELRVGDVRRFAEAMGDPDLVTADDVTAYFAARSWWKPATRRRVVVSLRVYFQWARDRGYLVHEPESALPNVRVSRNSLPPATEDAIRRALERATSKHERAAILLGGTMGLRRTEIAVCHPRDRHGPILHVNGKYDRVRRLTLDRQTQNTLLALEEEQGTEAHYFPGGSGTGHLHPATIYKLIKQLLGPEWSPHSLRRRAGRIGFDRTRNIRAVQEFLGHESLQTTQVYVHVNEDEIASVSKATSLGVATSQGGEFDQDQVAHQLIKSARRAREAGIDFELTLR